MNWRNKMTGDRREEYRFFLGYGHEVGSIRDGC